MQFFYQYMQKKNYITIGYMVYAIIFIKTVVKDLGNDIKVILQYFCYNFSINKNEKDCQQWI